jgi:hypothetical protein
MPVGEAVVVEEMIPHQVNLSFEPMEVAAVPLRPRVSGELPEGLSLARSPQVEPSLARVSGPRSRVESLEVLSLLPVNLSQLSRSGEYTRRVDTLGLGGLAFSPERAIVTIEVEETVERIFTDLPLDLPILGSDPQLQARPGVASLTVVGARSLVESLEPDRFRVTLSRAAATSLSPGEEIRVSLSVEGVPTLVEARLDPEWVLLRRPTGL